MTNEPQPSLFWLMMANTKLTWTNSKLPYKSQQRLDPNAALQRQDMNLNSCSAENYKVQNNKLLAPQTPQNMKHTALEGRHAD